MDGFKQSLVAQVDPKFGNDATAELENPNLKFRTITAAFQAIKDSGIPGLWTIQLFGNEHIDLPEFDQDVVICGNQATVIKEPIVCKNGATIQLHNLSLDTAHKTPIQSSEGTVNITSTTVSTTATTMISGVGCINNNTFNWTPEASSAITGINAVASANSPISDLTLCNNTYNVNFSQLQGSTNVVFYQNSIGGPGPGVSTTKLLDTGSTINMTDLPQPPPSPPPPPPIPMFTFVKSPITTNLDKITANFNISKPTQFLILDTTGGDPLQVPDVNFNKVLFTVPFSVPDNPYLLANGTEFRVTNSTWNGNQLPKSNNSNLTSSFQSSNEITFSQNYVTRGCTIITSGGLHVSTRTVNAVQDGPVSLVKYDDYSLFVDTSQGPVKLIIPPFTGDIEGKFLLFRNITPKCGPFKVEVRDGKIDKKWKGFKVPKILELQHSRGIWWRI